MYLYLKPCILSMDLHDPSTKSIALPVHNTSEDFEYNHSHRPSHVISITVFMTIIQ